MQRDVPEAAALGGPSARGPEGSAPADAVARVRGPSGEELEVAELRVAPADMEKLCGVVAARGGVVAPAASGDAGRTARSVAVFHPMDESGMHLVDLRSSEPGWVLGTFAAYHDTQTL